MHARGLPPQFRLLVLPWCFSVDVLKSRNCSCRNQTRPRRTCSPGTLLHSTSSPPRQQGPSLSHSLSCVSNREDSLPTKELTRSGHSLRALGYRDPLSTLNLIANGSQNYAGFPLQSKPSTALRQHVLPIFPTQAKPVHP